jgi:gluconolactonase
MRQKTVLTCAHDNYETQRSQIFVNRRRVLCAGAATIGASLISRVALGGWEPTERYPDPAIRVLDPRFSKYRLVLANVERLATGMRWSEGPVWIGDARCLLWSDLSNDRIMRWDERTHVTSTFREPANYANGNTRDRQGRLISCEQDSRRVTRTEYDGSITTLIDRFDGRRLNSPNDVVVKSDDSIWFSDPLYGINSQYEGHVAEQELPTRVYRLDAKTGRASVVIDEIRPNGLCFSPDEGKMYVVDYNLPGIGIYNVVANGTKLANGRTFFATAPTESPDGFRCDVDGNLWCGWAGGEHVDGVLVLSPDGTPIGRIDLPEECANVCFGGLKRNRLFMAASHSIYSLYVNTQGAVGG